MDSARVRCVSRGMFKVQVLHVEGRRPFCRIAIILYCTKIHVHHAQRTYIYHKHATHSHVGALRCVVVMEGETIVLE